MKIDKTMENGIDLKEINYTFVRNLPKSLTEDLRTFVQSGGQLSQETLMTLLGLVPDVGSELQKLQAERELPEYDFEVETEESDV